MTPQRRRPIRSSRIGASSRSRTGPKRRAARRKRRLLPLVLLIPVVLAALAAAVGFGGTVVFRSTCDLESLRPVRLGQNSFVYAADGSLLGSIPAVKNRQPVALAEMSPWVRRSTVAIEDRRFWKHGGVDYEGIARALWRDIKARHIVEGGSTITQQLVRNLYTGHKRTFRRKLKEACLAMKLSDSWSRARILSSYMNTIYFGHHAYGVEAASQTYYSKHAADLTLPQAALLAGLPQAPSRYDPFERPGVARARRDEVLRALLENHGITRGQYEWAVSLGLRLHRGRLYTRIREPYFFGYVRSQLARHYGPAAVRSGGLKVYTTIIPRFQHDAYHAIRDTLYYRSDPAAALVSINPATGAIEAMTGVSPGVKKSQFNLAAQGHRQAGSTFKTFVLTTAVSQGINPQDATYVSAPFTYQPPGVTKAWDVTTYDGSYAGDISVESATLRSDNTVYAQLTLDVGPKNVAAMAHRLGVRTKLAPVPSLGLGSIAVSPLEMASAYATLAAGGIYSKPMAIRQVILPNGKADRKWGDPKRTRAIPDGVAYTVTKILEQNMTSGTGVGAYFGRPAAGKTGTTENNADAWFCGYTPSLATAVWIGYPKGEIPMVSVHGITVSGPTFPATIWKRFMERAVGNSPAASFPTPHSYPVWKPFQRGQYAIAYTPTTTDYGSSGSDGYTSTPTPRRHTTTPPPPPPPPPIEPPPPPPPPPPVEPPPPPPPVEPPPPPPPPPPLPP